MIKFLSDKRFLFLLTISAISFIIAMSIYIKEMKTDIVWLAPEESMKLALIQNKFIYANLYSRWDPSSNLRYSTLFNNDKVTKYLNDNFIPVRFDIGNENEKQKLEEYFDTQASKFDFIADKHGRIISFLSTSTSYENFIAMLGNLTSLKFLAFDTFQDAKNKAKTKQRPLILLVSNYVNDNFFIHEILNIDSNYKFVIENFEVAVAMAYHRNDYEQIKFLADEKDESDALKTFMPLSGNILTDQRVYSTKPRLYMFDKNFNLVGKFKMEYDLINAETFRAKMTELMKNMENNQ